MLQDPGYGRRRIVDAVGDPYSGRQPVIYAGDGESLLLQSLRNVALAAFQTAAVEPYDRREPFLFDRVVEVEPAERVCVGIACGIAVGDVSFGAVGRFGGFFADFFAGCEGAAGEQCEEQQGEESFHKSLRSCMQLYTKPILKYYHFAICIRKSPPRRGFSGWSGL